MLKKIKKGCISILWRGHAENARGARVKWTQICLPKYKGGVGLKCLFHWSERCILKCIRLLFMRGGSLWIAWIRQYKLRDRILQSLKSGDHTCGAWFDNIHVNCLLCRVCGESSHNMCGAFFFSIAVQKEVLMLLRFSRQVHCWQDELD